MSGPEVLRVPIPGKPKRPKKRTILLLAFCSLILAAASVRYVFEFDFGKSFGEIYSEGPGQDSRDKAPNYKDLTTSAWSQLLNGNYAGALEEGHRALEFAQTPNDEARIHLALAAVYTVTGSFGEAQESLNFCRDVYVETEQSQNLGLVYVAEARLRIAEGDIQGAEASVEAATPLVTSKGGAVEWAKARIAFKNDDIGTAIDLSRAQLKKYQEDILTKNGEKKPQNKISIADAHSDLAFYLLVAGDYSRSVSHTDKADELIFQTGRAEGFYFNLVNRIVERKCMGLPFSHLEKMVLDYSRKTGNKLLLNHLNEALGIDCAPIFIRGGSGVPQPPDDPSPGNGTGNGGNGGGG